MRDHPALKVGLLQPIRPVPRALPLRPASKWFVVS